MCRPGPFAILPLTGDRSCITWTEDSREAKRIMALDDAGFLAEVEKRFGGKLGKVELAGPRQSWPLELHLARRYVGPRFAAIVRRSPAAQANTSPPQTRKFATWIQPRSPSASRLVG